jgi:hypothetical protein
MMVALRLFGILFVGLAVSTHVFSEPLSDQLAKQSGVAKTARPDFPLVWKLGYSLGQSGDLDGQGWQLMSVSASQRLNRQKKWSLSSGYIRRDSGDQGVADTRVRLTHQFNGRLLGAWWDFRGGVKLPTASEYDGLGTGSLDLSGRVQAIRRYGAVLGWTYSEFQRRGQSDRFRLQNGWGWGTGLSIDDWVVAYDAREASQLGQPVNHSISLVYRIRLSDDGSEATARSKTASKNSVLSPYVRLMNQDRWAAGFSYRF